MKRLLLLLCVLFVLLGCQGYRVADVLREPDPGFLRMTETEGLRLEVRYLPREYVLLSRSGIDSSRKVTYALLDSLESASGDANGLTFLLRISPRIDSGGAGLSQNVLYGHLSGYRNYQETQQEYLFGLKEKIWMESEGIRIPLAGYQMENTFGASSALTFMLLFTSPAEGAKKTRVKIVLDDIVPGLARRKLAFTLPEGSF